MRWRAKILYCVWETRQKKFSSPSSTDLFQSFRNLKNTLNSLCHRQVIGMATTSWSNYSTKTAWSCPTNCDGKWRRWETSSIPTSACSWVPASTRSMWPSWTRCAAKEAWRTFYRTMTLTLDGTSDTLWWRWDLILVSTRICFCRAHRNCTCNFNSSTRQFNLLTYRQSLYFLYFLDALN